MTKMPSRSKVPCSPGSLETRLHRRPAGKADRAAAGTGCGDRGGVAAVQRGNHDALRLGTRVDLLEGVSAAVTRGIRPGELRGLIQIIALITRSWQRGGERSQDPHTAARQAHRPDLG